MSKIALSGNASGTGTFTFAAPGTNTDRTLTLPDASGTVATTADIPSVNPFTLGTAVASTSGTAIDFTGIPSWAKRVTVMFAGVSLSSSSTFLLQIGDSGGVEATGYSSVGLTPSSAYLSPTNGFSLCASSVAAQLWSGQLALTLLTGNTWVLSGVIGSPTNYIGISTGSKALSDTLDRVRITTANGTDTFDAGTINVSWEG
jgi:hypothetical protein